MRNSTIVAGAIGALLCTLLIALALIARPAFEMNHAAILSADSRLTRGGPGERRVDDRAAEDGRQQRCISLAERRYGAN